MVTDPVAAPRRWCSATPMACGRPTRPTSVASGSPNVLCNSDPPTAEELVAATEFASGEAGSGICRGSRRTGADLGGVAGTMTTLSAIGMGLPEYDSDVIHLSRISLPDLNSVCERLIAMTRVDRAELGPMHPGRVDVIGGGSLVTMQLAREFSGRAGITELVVSEHDIPTASPSVCCPLIPEELSGELASRPCLEPARSEVLR